MNAGNSADDTAASGDASRAANTAATRHRIAKSPPNAAAACGQDDEQPGSDRNRDGRPERRSSQPAPSPQAVRPAPASRTLRGRTRIALNADRRQIRHCGSADQNRRLRRQRRSARRHDRRDRSRCRRSAAASQAQPIAAAIAVNTTADAAPAAAAANTPPTPMAAGSDCPQHGRRYHAGGGSQCARPDCRVCARPQRSTTTASATPAAANAAASGTADRRSGQGSCQASACNARRRRGLDRSRRKDAGSAKQPQPARQCPRRRWPRRERHPDRPTIRPTLRRRTAAPPQAAQAASGQRCCVPAQADAGAQADSGHATHAGVLSAHRHPMPPARQARNGAAAPRRRTPTACRISASPLAIRRRHRPSRQRRHDRAAAAAAVPVAGLAVAIAARAQAGSNQFDIRLDPPELGRIDVRLDVDSNGQVTSHVTVDRADTLRLAAEPAAATRTRARAGRIEDRRQRPAVHAARSILRRTEQQRRRAADARRSLSFPTPICAPVETTQIYSRLGLGSGIDIRV